MCEKLRLPAADRRARRADRGPDQALPAADPTDQARRQHPRRRLRGRQRRTGCAAAAGAARHGAQGDRAARLARRDRDLRAAEESERELLRMWRPGRRHEEATTSTAQARGEHRSRLSQPATRSRPIFSRRHARRGLHRRWQERRRSRARRARRRSGHPLALQHGVRIDAIRHAVTRNDRNPSSIFGAVVDRITQQVHF